MKIISCNGNRKLAEDVAKHLKIELCKAEVKRFSDQEVWVEILENVRGEDCFVIQPTSCPTNDNFMELLVTIDACRRGSAKRITAVMPYYGYARQDRKSGPRTPITAKLVARMLETAGVDRVLTMDLHANQIQGFFEVPTDNLFAMPTLLQDIRAKVNICEGVCVVSPDVGGVVRARAYAKHLNDADLAIIDKRRPSANVAEVMNIIGDVCNKDCILVDDMADSAGTLCNAATAIMEQGAKSVMAYVSHGVFSGPAMERIEHSALSEVVSTDSIAMTDKIAKNSKIRHVTIAPLIAEAISRIAREKSISELFNVK